MLDPTGGIVTSAVAAKATQTIVKSSLIATVWDSVVDFAVDQAKSHGKNEFTKRIEGLRSDTRLRKQIQTALERAVIRWVDGSPDTELVSAVAQSTTFADLPSVQTAIRTIARSPFDNTAASTLTTSFRQVLPTDFDDHRIDRGVKEFLDALREEFAAVSTLQQTLSVQAAIQSNRSIERIETLLQQLLDGPQSSAETLQDYLTWVIDQHRYLDPRGSRQTVRQVQVPLDEIYVSLRAEEEPALSVSDRYLYEDDLAELQNRGDLLGEELEDLRENILARYLKHEQPSRRGQATELNVLVNTHPKLVILGDPGAGKTHSPCANPKQKSKDWAKPASPSSCASPPTPNTATAAVSATSFPSASVVNRRRKPPSPS